MLGKDTFTSVGMLAVLKLGDVDCITSSRPKLGGVVGVLSDAAPPDHAGKNKVKIRRTRRNLRIATLVEAQKWAMRLCKVPYARANLPYL